MTVVRSEEILKPNTVQVALNVRDNNRSVVISQSHVKQTELIKINEGQDGEEELINFPQLTNHKMIAVKTTIQRMKIYLKLQT